MLRAALAATLLAATRPAAAGACPPTGWTPPQLAELKADGFALADADARQALALGLVACLADPDPTRRDGLAFEALSAWMRADRLDVATRRTLLQQLMPMLGAQDAGGFQAPFAALVLSEVVRTDRISPWLRAEERAAVAAQAAAYLAGVRDYRGFVDGQGWRHVVAHGADLVLQLALDPAVADADLPPLLAAVGAQAATDRHAFIHGEPERLARATLYLARRSGLDDAQWQAWFAALPAGADDPATPASEAGLVRRHNLRAFLSALHLGAEGSADPGWQALDHRVLATLQALPQ